MINKKIKVLHVISTRPIGGIGTFLKQISFLIDKEKFDFHFIFSSQESDGDFDKNIKLCGFTVHVLPSFKKNVLKYIKYSFNFYRKNAPLFDIVHVHSPNTGFLDLLFSFIFGINARIIHSHSTSHSDKILKSYRNMCLHKLSVKLSKYRLACSYEAGLFLFNKASFITVNNSINLESFKFDLLTRHSMREKLCIDEGDILLGHIGYFEKVKNHCFLIKVMSYLIKERGFVNVKLLLIGSGSLFENMKNKVAFLGLEKNIYFLGQRQDISSILQSLDMFLLPSLFEGFPLSIIEAQASGLPCIVSDTLSSSLNICGQVKFLSIKTNDDVVLWGEEIIKNPLRRYSIKDKMSEYDINKQVRVLENLYKKML